MHIDLGKKSRKTVHLSHAFRGFLRSVRHKLFHATVKQAASAPPARPRSATRGCLRLEPRRPPRGGDLTVNNSLSRNQRRALRSAWGNRLKRSFWKVRSRAELRMKVSPARGADDAQGWGCAILHSRTQMEMRRRKFFYLALAATTQPRAPARRQTLCNAKGDPLGIARESFAGFSIHANAPMDRALWQTLPPLFACRARHSPVRVVGQSGVASSPPEVAQSVAGTRSAGGVVGSGVMWMPDRARSSRRIFRAAGAAARAPTSAGLGRPSKFPSQTPTVRLPS